MRKLTKQAICLTSGAIFIVIGCILIPVFHHLVRSDIIKKLPIGPGSLTYKDWVTPPVPVFFSVWVFDLINRREVVSDGEKPFVVQRGPYTYREHRKKFDIVFNKNSTVSYKERRWFEFQRALSVGPEDDTFVTVNIAMMTIATKIKYQYKWIKELTELVLDATGDRHLFDTYKVKDILWGYKDPLLTKVNAILREYNKTIDDKIGLFYGQNNSDDGAYTIFTGETDSSKFAMIDEWQGTRTLPYWTTYSCNMINGTDGTLFPPFIKQGDVLYVFSTDICRSLYLKFDKKYEERDIPLYRFIIPDSLFARTEDNAGFCTPAGNCQPAGLLNVTNCKNAPIFMSQPHFYASDPEVIAGVYGMNPTHGEHQTNIDVEPNTGIAVNVNKKLQVNIYIQNISNIKDTEKMAHIFYPVAWLNESAKMNQAVANQLESDVIMPINVTIGVQYGLIIIGGFFTLAVLIYIVVDKFRYRNEPTPSPEEKTKLVQRTY